MQRGIQEINANKYVINGSFWGFVRFSVAFYFSSSLVSLSLAVTSSELVSYCSAVIYTRSVATSRGSWGWTLTLSTATYGTCTKRTRKNGVCLPLYCHIAIYTGRVMHSVVSPQFAVDCVMIRSAALIKHRLVTDRHRPYSIPRNAYTLYMHHAVKKVRKMHQNAPF